MNKTADYCRVFGGYAAGELLCKERKCVRLQLLKRLESYEQALRDMIDAAKANLESLKQIQRKFNRRDPDGRCWHEPPPADLWKHLRSLGLNV
jgi:hypothetical protein